MSESITKELRGLQPTPNKWLHEEDDGTVSVCYATRIPEIYGPKDHRVLTVAWDALSAIADRIDARFTHELRAKQAELNALKADNADLQARLDASIPLPVDSDGVPWTGDEERFFDVDGKEFAMSGILWDGESWSLCDETSGGQMYGFYACHHVAPEQPDSQERIADELDEMVDAACSADDRCKKLADLAERIRRQAKREGE